MANWEIQRPQVDTSTTVVVTGTVQGSATLTNDYIALGFDSFTNTAWQATIPVGKSSVTLGLDVVSDANYEPTESVFLTMTGVTGGTIDPLRKTFLFTIIDDDSIVLTRVVATGSNVLVGDPPLTTPSTGVASATSTFPLTVRYSATNAKPLELSLPQKDLFDGGQVWVELGFNSTANPSNSNNTIFTVAFNGASFKLDYIANSINVTAASNAVFEVGNNINAVVQIRFFAGQYTAYFNGTQVATGYYAILTATNPAAVIWSNTTAFGSGYDVAGLRITRGRYTPQLGTYAP